MKKLIIAEKPSLGRAIAAAFFNIKNGHGYLYNDEVVITWAFGHLLEPEALEFYRFDYNPELKYKFKDTPLPVLPPNLQYKLKEEGKAQFEIIKKLMNSPDIDEIISAGDADREGEVIIRLIIEKGLNEDKQMTRLWLPDQTVETIQKAYANRKNISEYNNLYREGLARAYIDWTWGINLSRAVAIRGNMKCSVGRVVTPIVLSIYNKEKDIQNFIKDYYYIIESQITVGNLVLKLSGKEKFDKKDNQLANERATLFNRGKLAVENIERKTQKKGAGKLFSLSKLQGFAGEKLKLTPAETLEQVQKIYEKGLVTYPRTNTEYLSENEKSKISEVIDCFKRKGKTIVFKDSKNIFDTSKIESHSAIIPTGKVPGQLTNREEAVYNLILNRFLAVFYAKDCVLDVVNVIFKLKHDKGIEKFNIKGKTLKEKGWMEVEAVNMHDSLIPDLHVGEIINKDFKPILKSTEPPKRFTVETLNEYLKNPFKEESKDADEEYKAILAGAEIGTEATRAGLIDKAIKLSYISLKNNVYHILHPGENIIEVLYKLNMIIDVQNTVLMAKDLKKIYKGQDSLEDVLERSREHLRLFFSSAEGITIEKKEKEQPLLGTCPICKKDVVKRKGPYGFFYSCSDKDCSFIIGKIAGKSLTDNQVSKLLLNGKSEKIKGFTSKTGKNFEAILKINTKGKLEFEF